MMNYYEAFATLNDEQHEMLIAVMDKALRAKLPDNIIVGWIMQGICKSCPELNQDQRCLFHDIAEYTVMNRDRIRQVIREDMKREFFRGLDRLMTEQESLKGDK